MSFQEIKLIPVANCITQGHGGAAVALLKGSQPRGPLEAEVQTVLRSPNLGGEQLHQRNGSFFLVC